MAFDPASLKFNDDGLVPAIAQDADSGEVLMMAWMNAEAVRRTLETGRVTYWSRSRQAFWVKGETSGHVQELVDFLRLGKFFPVARAVLLEFFADDVVAEFDAFVADVNAGAGDEFSDLVLAFTAERAVENLAVCPLMFAFTQ